MEEEDRVEPAVLGKGRVTRSKVAKTPTRREREH